jgi:hypothetical protein
MGDRLEIGLRMIIIFISIFLQLVWAKNSLPAYDEFLFVGTAFFSIVTFFYISSNYPHWIVKKKVSNYTLQAAAPVPVYINNQQITD